MKIDLDSWWVIIPLHIIGIAVFIFGVLATYMWLVAITT